jgi:hypothetical protein
MASAIMGPSKSLIHPRGSTWEVTMSGSLVVTLFEDVHEESGLLVGIVAKPQVIEDQNLGFDEATDVVEVTAGGLGGLDFLEEEVDRQKLSGMAFLAQSFTQSDGEMSFSQARFPKDQKILLVMEKAYFGEFFDPKNASWRVPKPQLEEITEREF